ncbi:MAG: hypothetical protein KAQ87_03125 [Candidatus Pacebacteria bacterium]|nr:hypothetical protein [Candidatus Paceibacterota bacterium]
MFKTKDYILTPVDLHRGILHLVKKAGPKDIIGLAVLAGLFVFFRNYLEWQIDSSLFMLFWIALFYWKLDSRISIAGALACLISCPILLILFEKDILLLGEEYAEQAAVWAYYFLVIGVIKQIWEFRKESKEEKIVENTKLKPKQTYDLTEAENIDKIIKKTEIKSKQNKKHPKIIMDIIPPNQK